MKGETDLYGAAHILVRCISDIAAAAAAFAAAATSAAAALYPSQASPPPPLMSEEQGGRRRIRRWRWPKKVPVIIPDPKGLLLVVYCRWMDM